MPSIAMIWLLSGTNWAISCSRWCFTARSQPMPGSSISRMSCGQSATRRHPHIFGEAAESPGWEQIKADERETSGQSSALDGVALALPALLRAQKIQKRAARVGFDWPDKAPVKDKLLEELDEVAAADSDEQVHEEIGDLLFSAVNLARHYKVDAERALADATDKFTRRFNLVEASLDKDMKEMTLEELEAEWKKAKASLATG